MMMNRYKLTSAVKSAIGIGAFAIALIGCGSDGKDGEDGNNGNIGIDIQQATSLKANILHATITEGVVAVDFELLTANGVAVSGLESFDDINALGFGIAKLDALQKR
ncbi:OmcA/MtrC family decaheme c-type cytochrome, partial [Shewanella sp. 0m-11]